MKKMQNPSTQHSSISVRRVVSARHSPLPNKEKSRRKRPPSRVSTVPNKSNAFEQPLAVRLNSDKYIESSCFESHNWLPWCGIYAVTYDESDLYYATWSQRFKMLEQHRRRLYVIWYVLPVVLIFLAQSAQVNYTEDISVSPSVTTWAYYVQNFFNYTSYMWI
jgi:hypothetical protein